VLVETVATSFVTGVLFTMQILNSVVAAGRDARHDGHCGYQAAPPTAACRACLADCRPRYAIGAGLARGARQPPRMVAVPHLLADSHSL
jgi:hypothetical protein